MIKKTKKKILLIEDDPFQIEMYALEFEDYGYKMLAAKKGLEGLRLAKKQKPDIILLDLLLDDIDGFLVLKRLKADPQTKDIPVIILTNLARRGAEKNGLTLGAEAFIRKTRLMPRHVVGMVRAKLEQKELEKKKIKKKKEKILLIEDDQFQREMYSTKFALCGYNLILAVNGEEGLEKARQQKIDLILLDLALPIKSGYDVLKELKKDRQTKDIPVVAFTVSPPGNIPEEARKFILKHTVHYFQKPLHTPQEAVEITEKILKMLKK